MGNMLKTLKQGFMMRLFVMMLAGIVAGGFTSCKSQKKIAAEKAAVERAQKIEKAKQDILKVINDKGTLTLSQKEDIVSQVKGMNLNDPELNALIEKADEIIARERKEAERLRKEKEDQAKKAEEVKKEEEQKFNKIEDYLDGVAASKSLEMSATRINETLKFFASPDAPVLIIIHQEGDMKDYDKPTTIKKYLEYLKDQGKNPNNIYNIQYDANGKITELELIKK